MAARALPEIAGLVADPAEGVDTDRPQVLGTNPGSSATIGGVRPKSAVTVLGWISAVLLNVGPLLFLAGLIIPQGSGGGPSSVLVTGLALTALGLASGAAWLFASRANERQR